LGPEGGRPGRPTQAVRHTCSEKLGIVKILRYIRSGMYTAFFVRKMTPWPCAHLNTMVNLELPTPIPGRFTF